MRHIPLKLMPILILNRLRRRLGLAQEVRAYGRTFLLRDSKKSCTLDIVNLEHAAGFYAPPCLISGDFVLDVGAHVGGFCIPLAKMHPGTYIFAFEPDPDNFALLVRNLDANKITNVLAMNAGLVSREGEKLVTERDETNTGGTRTITSDDGVKGYTFAQMVEMAGHKPIMLAKIDVEGAEHGCDFDFSKVHAVIAELHSEAYISMNQIIKKFQECPDHRLYIEPFKPYVIENA